MWLPKLTQLLSSPARVSDPPIFHESLWWKALQSQVKREEDLWFNCHHGGSMCTV